MAKPPMTKKAFEHSSIDKKMDKKELAKINKKREEEKKSSSKRK